MVGFPTPGAGVVCVVVVVGWVAGALTLVVLEPPQADSPSTTAPAAPQARRQSIAGCRRGMLGQEARDKATRQLPGEHPRAPPPRARHPALSAGGGGAARSRSASPRTRRSSAAAARGGRSRSLPARAPPRDRRSR